MPARDPETLSQPTLAQLAGNAKGYQYDPVLEPIADAMDHGDYNTWSRVHPLLQDRASMYRDFRAAYRTAVAAGAIADDRTPGSNA